MCPLYMAHRRIAPCLHDLDHGLVVLMELDALRTTEEQVPQRKCGNALETYGDICGHYLSFGSAV